MGNKKNGSIEKGLKKDKLKYSKEKKLLLLGAGESGKSTFFKQVKILHNNGFSEEEKKSYRDGVRTNIVDSMKNLITATQKLNIPLLDEESKIRAEKILKINNMDEYTLEVGDDLKKLWQNKSIQDCLPHRSKFQLYDSTEYFFQNIDRINEIRYQPTEIDIIRCRVKTTGITEVDFDFEKSKFKLVDVGGQRNERKKWIHCFEDVSAIIFVGSLSEYDLKCYEDDQTMRMKESLFLFDEITNSKFFKDTPIILLLNKDDLFKKKIIEVDLSVCFDNYDGGKDYEKAIKFIEEQFRKQNHDETKDKRIKTFVTTATDQDSIKKIFNSIKDIFY